MSNDRAVNSRVIPEDDVYISPHIGGIDFASTSDKINVSDVELDRDINYTNTQKSLIDLRKDTLYKRDQHDETFDLPTSGYNHVSDIHPLGINMVANHTDRGYDYRDFPKELEKDRTLYDPYVGYLHKNGLIGKNKVQYTVHYINIDSSTRKKDSVATTKNTIRLDTNPLSFNGQFLRIYTQDTDLFSLNDKITITDITEKETTLRTIITDDMGNSVSYFSTNEGVQYMTVLADSNIQINSGLTSEIKNQFNDIYVNFDGFIGDKKTEWYFDTRIYSWTMTPTVNSSGVTVYNLVITEDVLGVTSASSGNTEPNQVKENMLIAEMTIDKYGNVIFINPNVPYNLDDIRWTEPSTTPGQGTLPEGVPAAYYTDAISSLTQFGLNTPPNVPTSIYTAMEYFDKVQNTIRPIFLTYMTTVTNFNLRYSTQNKVYPTTVRIVVPEATVISTTSSVGNMPLNMLNGLHRLFLTSADVERDLGTYNSSSTTSSDIPEANKFYIKLLTPFAKRKFEYTNPLLSGALLIKVYEATKTDVTITYNHYGGVPVKNMVSDYPTGFNSLDGFKYVVDIVDGSYIVVDLNRVGLYDKRFGGDSVIIGLIQDIDTGYTNPNQYVLDIEKVYTNVVMIRMISSAFPVTQKNIMDGLTGGKRNNRFYWQNIDDSSDIYMIELEPGDYTPLELKTAFETSVQQIPRINDTFTDIFNYIIMDINDITDEVKFSSYNIFIPNFGDDVYVKKTSLSEINQICTSMMTQNNNSLPPEDAYYQYPNGDYFLFFPNTNIQCDGIRIIVYHPNHTVKVFDEITISNSLNYDDIPEKYLNGKHIVTRAVPDYYDFIITNVNLDPTLPMSNGGNEIKIYTPNLFRIRFDFADTFGSELGFRNVGASTSITPYQYVITNDVLYENEDLSAVLANISNNTVSVSDINPDTVAIRNSINLNGPPYILIVCSEIKSSKNLGPVKDYLYRINLSNRLNTTIYNSFAKSPIILNEPLTRLDQLTIDIMTPDGYHYDFNGADHSFVLEITTCDEIPEATLLKT